MSKISKLSYMIMLLDYTQTSMEIKVYLTFYKSRLHPNMLWLHPIPQLWSNPPTFDPKHSY